MIWYGNRCKTGLGPNGTEQPLPADPENKAKAPRRHPSSGIDRPGGRRRARPVLADGVVYASQAEACRALGIAKSSLSRALGGSGRIGDHEVSWALPAETGTSQGDSVQSPPVERPEESRTDTVEAKGEAGSRFVRVRIPRAIAESELLGSRPAKSPDADGFNLLSEDGKWRFRQEDFLG